MKLKNNTFNQLLASALLLIALVFTCVSIWLIRSVNSKREKVEDLVGQVSVISDLEVKLMDCLEHSEDREPDAFQLAIEKVVETEFYLDDFPDLTELSDKTAALEEYFQVSGVLMNFKPFQDDLKELYVDCVDLKKDKRTQLSTLSDELGTYWDYTHTLIVLACLLALILAIAGVAIFRSRRKLHRLKIRNSLFMDGVVDCVIVCNNKGKITEYNAAAESILGYTPNEAIGMPIRQIYATDEDYETVQKAFRQFNFFKGEVVNVRKNGEQFISYLSANVVYDENGVRTGTMGISRDITTQKRNSEQFQHIVDNATDIIYTTNVQGEITYVNTSANSVLGYSNDDFIGMSFRDLIHPDYLEEVETHYNQQFRNRAKETYLEFKMIKANGDEIWIGQNVRTDFSPTNPDQITGFFGILRNLDEFKKAQIDLEESESRYRELFDNSKDLIQSIDANGGLLYVNDAWKHALGYSDAELRQLNLFDIIHSDSRDYCEELLEEILKHGSNDDEREHIFKMVTKDEAQLILKGTISVKYEGGLVKSIQTFLRDVTERHKMEQALEKSEENFRQISKSINDVFFLYNVETEKYEFISSNCKDIFGVEPDFFLKGKNYTEEFVHPEDAERIEELNHSVRSGEVGHVEYRRKCEDHQIKWIDEKWFPISDENGKVVSISGICRDITDVKVAYNTIYEQNREISQSILYAKNIQESTLPTKEEVKNILPDSFVFYKAKDILSGDLYIVDSVKGTNGNDWPAFIVGDCTGHGVPGGLLSLLCSGLLTESLTHPKINSPAEAMDFVREKLIRLFRSNPSKYILDGMDAAFCVLNPEENELYFSGANLSCYIVRGEEVIEYKGDKQHIGYSSLMAPFVHFAIDVEKGDVIYLTTDGYVDQFGGEKNKKFLRKRLTEMLVKIQDLPMTEQRKKIAERFEEWKGDSEQTDDIAMIGVRI